MAPDRQEATDWHRIGTGLADWHRIGGLAPDWQGRCQSQAITEDICLDNLGTIALYGMVPGLLGG